MAYTVRQGRQDDMAGLLTLVQAEGWNTVIEHLHFQFDLYPAGSFVAESSDGEIIGKYDFFLFFVFCFRLL